MPDPEAYFGQVPAVSSDLGEGNWFDLEREVAPFQMVPGLMFRPIVGEKVALNLVSFEPNTEARLHAHSEEQITYVLEGEFEFEVNGVRRILRPGMGVVIPPNVPHAARTHDTTCLELDFFHPPREGLLNAMRSLQADDDAGGAG